MCVWFREGGALAPSIGQPPLDFRMFGVHSNSVEPNVQQYRIILCESGLRNTDAIRSVPLKVQSSVPNPNREPSVSGISTDKQFFVLYFVIYAEVSQEQH